MPIKKIYVTEPNLPPLENFQDYLKEIWDSKWLTNNGKFHQQFEKELADYLGVRYISLFTNGTLGLLTALQALRITGEVITTPYTFVATIHALHWNGIKPVFVDIEPEYCNINPEKIESAITNNTTAILPVHVYGNPCDIEKIQQIADTYGLKIIYDAAHAFNVKHKGHSILNHDDLSVLSFHATKVFNTMEGGAIICQDEKIKKRIDYLKNFGFANETTVVAPGINAKMTEFQSALGILQLKEINKMIQARKKVALEYKRKLGNISGILRLKEMPSAEINYSYFPIFIDAEKYGKTRDEIYKLYRDNNIFVRRYFYPLVSSFPMYKNLPSASPNNLPVANQIANQVLCLPIYPNLKSIDIDRIIKIIKD